MGQGSSFGSYLGSDPIFVVPYDPNWPEIFERERERIEAVIGTYVLEIEHIGSTAVPELAAKPVIDIMVGVGTLDETPACVSGLVGIGYEYVPEFGDIVPLRRYFRKFDAEGNRTHQIYLIERSNKDWWDRHVLFRDYLRTNQETAREYGDLKLSLASRFQGDRAGYMDTKADFVLSVERRALRTPGSG